MDSKTAGAFWEASADNWARQVRAGKDVYRDLHNTPAFMEVLPSVKGLSGLDMGCGEGTNTRTVAGRGAQMTAIDIAPTFVRRAQEAEVSDPLGIEYLTADATDLPFGNASFDFATAFMSMMDLPDPALAIAEAYRVLKPGGFFQFSILHPCFTPRSRKVLRDDDENVLGIQVSQYFEQHDKELDEWHFSTLTEEEKSDTEPFKLPFFHQTLSAWINALATAGFTIEAMQEPRATAEQATAEPVIADTCDVPLFLHIRARKTETLTLLARARSCRSWLPSPIRTLGACFRPFTNHLMRIGTWKKCRSLRVCREHPS